ncbi:MAG: hypothetical protein LBF78_03025 [Treponema sp.]|nr:hypothetical protein [Treponema sp.]
MISVFILLSCATSPKLENFGGEDRADFSVLPSGAKVYLWADVEKGRPLLDAVSFAGFDGKNSGDALDRTGIAVAALYPESAARRFFLAGWGKYPNVRAGMSMAFSRDWKKKKSASGGRYWFSKSLNLGVALGPYLVFVSDGDPLERPAVAPDGAAVLNSVKSPPGFEEFRKPCVFAGFLPESYDVVNRFASAMDLPMQIPAKEFFFGASRIPGDEVKWEPLFCMQFASENEAKGLFNLLILARMFMNAQSAAAVATATAAGSGLASVSAVTAAFLLPLIFENEPELSGRNITLRMTPMTTEELSLLFHIFSVY